MAKRGRPKGSKGIRTVEIEELAARLKVDPFEILLLFAKGDWKRLGYKSETRIITYTKHGDPIEGDVIKPEMRLAAASEAVKYLRPKLQAIQHSGLDNGPIEYANLTDSQLEERLDEIIKQKCSQDPKS